MRQVITDNNQTEISKKVRRSVLQMLASSKASHLGSNMSVIEILIAMYRSVDCEQIKIGSASRSRVIVSKGHCAAATYAVLSEFGLLESEYLESYHKDNSFLAGHVSHKVPFVEHSTGALGHGINVAVGCAIGLRSRQNYESKVLTLVGDGEIQEGSVWEAIMLVGHMQLPNFVLLIDNNQISSIRRTCDVINLQPLSEKFDAFGLLTYEVNGHSIDQICTAIKEIGVSSRPGVVICNTTKGKGVKFAENDPVWHYRTLSDELLAQALADLG